MVFAKGKSHEQDGETLSRAAMPRPEKASGDPAMAFGPSFSEPALMRAVQESAAASLPQA
jgi:hypothetical protein